ncbi:helix-turn-helix domain-containing protein [Paracoccus sp. T5]|uniref:helix-turn-helix domain-containing protein n=1 Tax=Paracoccus sp. T5 TaxID=3402161 RepID=UPI003AED2D54
MKINIIISFHTEHLLPALPVQRRRPMLAPTSIDESCRGVNNLVGSDIRALRKSRGLTIADLTSALGRSVGWLSQVERGHTVPSVRDLAAIAAYFDVSLNFFFRCAHQNPEEQGLVLRAADRMAIGSSETGLTEELLSPTLGGSFEMIMSTFAPGSDSGGPKAARPSEDGGVLISGQLTMWIGALKVVLHPGDSFQFRESTYAWENEGTEPAVVIWVISPPVY